MIYFSFAPGLLLPSNLITRLPVGCCLNSFVPRLPVKSELLFRAAVTFSWLSNIRLESPHHVLETFLVAPPSCCANFCLNRVQAAHQARGFGLISLAQFYSVAKKVDFHLQ